MPDRPRSSKTVDFALVEQLGVDKVADALGLSASSVRNWRNRGVPKGHQAAIAKLAEPEERSTESISSMRDRLTQADDEDDTHAVSSSPPAWDDDDDGDDQVPATAPASAPTASAPTDRRQPAGPTVVRDQRSRSGFRSSHSGARPEAMPPPPEQETRKPVRLNRKAVLAVTGGLAAAIVVGLAHGMTQVGGSTATSPAADDDEPVFQPLGPAYLPTYTYADLPQQAALTVAAELPKAEPEPAPAPEKARTVVVSARGPDRHAEEEEAALQSPLFPGGASSARSAAPVSAAGASSTEATLAALDRLRGSLPTPQDLTPQGQGRLSAGDGQQESFLDARLDEAIYLKNGLQKPLSDYEVKAGTIIPAALITGLNSDLPGEIIGQVTEHVYDTASGQHLLIPQGAKIFGRYNAAVGYGQERAQIVWDRLIMPNGNSVQLEAMVGTDKAGYAGLALHLGRLMRPSATARSAPRSSPASSTSSRRSRCAPASSSTSLWVET